jgi:acetyl esterase/lipase
MGSRHLVDPELLRLLELFPTIELSAQMLPVIRSRVLPLPSDPQAAEEVTVVTRMIPGPPSAPDVSVSIYAPRTRSGTLPCIFYIHGGGFVAGSALALQPVHRLLALKANCVIVSVDYRLAPETRFPGAIEDCYAALGWVFSHSRELGIDTGRVGVMGASAGGGLAAALALLARDRGEYQLAFQHLNYPMLDDRTCVRHESHPYAGQFIWTPHNNVFGWTSLLGVAPGSPGISPYAAAARADDLSGLPTTFISTGSLDLFVEEDIEYARRLIRHGVSVELHIYPGAFHAFDISADAQVATRARLDGLVALRRVLHPVG